MICSFQILEGDFGISGAVLGGHCGPTKKREHAIYIYIYVYIYIYTVGSFLIVLISNCPGGGFGGPGGGFGGPGGGFRTGRSSGKPLLSHYCYRC